MANDKKLSQDEKLRQLDDNAAYDAEMVEEEEEKSVAPLKSAKSGGPDKREKKTKKKDPNKRGFFERIGKWFKDAFAELKKVTWPTFPKTMKQTGVVLGVVLFFLILLFGFDLGLRQLYNLLFTNIAA